MPAGDFRRMRIAGPWQHAEHPVPTLLCDASTTLLALGIGTSPVLVRSVLLGKKEVFMPHHQTSTLGTCHISTNGCLVDDDRWQQRKAQALELVERRYLTLREASEQFGLPPEEITATRH